MQVVFREAKRLVEKREPFVLATVIRAKGSTPQKPGARLLVRRDGGIVGTLGGGCIEAAVWTDAKRALEERTSPYVQEFALNEELAAQDGLVCGGTMEILVDPIYDGEELLYPLEEIIGACGGGPSVALVSSTKGNIGARLFVREDGSQLGSLGDTAGDQDAKALARKLMAYGKAESFATESGGEFFVQAFTTPPTILIAGGGHIAKALYTLAKPLGFRVVIVDDRPEFASKERFPEADAVYAKDFTTAFKEVPITSNYYIVVATRGHKFDDLALEYAARSPARYVGLVGSRRKTILIYQSLLAHGIPLERVKEIHAPVGLNLGGRTPEEISLAILAEIAMVRLGGDARPLKLSDKYILKALEKAKTSALETLPAKP